MKIVLIVILSGICFDTNGQLFELLENEWYADILNPREKDFKPYTVGDLKGDTILNEGKFWDGLNEQFAISADLIVNEDTSMMIRNSEALLHGDTLDLLITQMDASSSHNFQIRIIKDKCFVFYDYSGPMDQANRKLETTEFSLTIDSGDFKKNKALRGHVTYQGRCTTYCDDWLSKRFKIDGGFIAVIK